MTRLTFECPETGKPLTAMTVEDAEAPMRVAVHCPKCSKLHFFSAAEAVGSRRWRWPEGVRGPGPQVRGRSGRIGAVRPMWKRGARRTFSP